MSACGARLGRKLLENLHAAALDLGVSRLSLSVDVSNLRAMRLYERFGYVPRGIVGGSRTMEVNSFPRPSRRSPETQTDTVRNIERCECVWMHWRVSCEATPENLRRRMQGRRVEEYTCAHSRS